MNFLNKPIFPDFHIFRGEQRVNFPLHLCYRILKYAYHRKQQPLCSRKMILRRNIDRKRAFFLIKEMEKKDVSGFINYVRMSPYQFHTLCEGIKNDIMKPVTRFHRPISPEDRLILTLRYLATGL